MIDDGDLEMVIKGFESDGDRSRYFFKKALKNDKTPKRGDEVQWRRREWFECIIAH